MTEPITEEAAEHCRVEISKLGSFIHTSLTEAGADNASADAVTKALIGASCRGVDSHGVRLLPHYIDAVQGGRIKGTPNVNFRALTPGTGIIDADDGFGHLAGYRAVEEGIKLAETTGIAAISIINSSHFGAAGAYTLAAAEAGYMAMAVSNSDKLVLAHDGVSPFHGTNPFSFAAPVPGQQPYLIDMATSAIPWNRVLQYGAIDRQLPEHVAVDDLGQMTTSPENVSALLPFGGEIYGYKGAAIAGLCDMLSAGLTGMGFSHQLLAMSGPDYTTKRKLGHFIILLKPDAFIPPEDYKTHVASYLKDLRQQSSNAEHKTVMAPGDREWKTQIERQQHGIPLDKAMWTAFVALAEKFKIPPPVICP